jgi:membrane-associated protein
MLISSLLAWFGQDQTILNMLTQNWRSGISIVALIVFCETALVFLPFLPGDSLLFATGAFLGVSGVSPWFPAALITVAAVAGDGLNFSIGRSIVGRTLIRRGWVKPQHLATAREYFARFGGATVTMARFIPVVRTLAPFVAGMSEMHPRRFLGYNILGGVLWCTSLLSAGFWLGKVPWVQDHISWLSLGIVAVSVLPVLVKLQARFAARER